MAKGNKQVKIQKQIQKTQKTYTTICKTKEKTVLLQPLLRDNGIIQIINIKNLTFKNGN